MTDRKVIHLSETDSTNKYIRTVEEPGVCVIADRQTGGRGRRGRTFESPEGGLYMSFKCRSADVTGDRLTAKAAVAVSHAVEKLTGLCTGIKWVNDIYAEGKKLCGILAEGVWKGDSLDCIIMGIGVNLRGALPDSLKDIATTVEECGGVVPAPEDLALEILSEFDSLGEFCDEYRERQILIGKEVTVHRGDEVYTAVAETTDGECRMVLRLPDGRRITADSGEVSLRING